MKFQILIVLALMLKTLLGVTVTMLNDTTVEWENEGAYTQFRVVSPLSCGDAPINPLDAWISVGINDQPYMVKQVSLICSLNSFYFKI
jgi:hypothetical protein